MCSIKNNKMSLERVSSKFRKGSELEGAWGILRTERKLAAREHREDKERNKAGKPLVSPHRSPQLPKPHRSINHWQSSVNAA